MTPESITVSLEWAKKLKEAGWPQDVCHFRYCGGHTWFHDDQENGKYEECPYDGLLESDEYCPTAELTCEFTLAAPTAEEILRRLPRTVPTPQGDGLLSIGKDGESWYVEYYELTFTHADTLANAAAAMFCYLAEHKLLP